MDAKEMIKVNQLNKSFGDLHVLKNINMSVYESDVVCLIGASGSGKSTLLRCLNFLEKKDNGQIIIEGNEIYPDTDNLNKIVSTFQLIPTQNCSGKYYRSTYHGKGH